MYRQTVNTFEAFPRNRILIYVEYTVIRRSHRKLVAPSRLESRNLLAGDLGALWHAAQPEDVPDGPTNDMVLVTAEEPLIVQAQLGLLAKDTDYRAGRTGATLTLPTQQGTMSADHQLDIIINELHVNPDVATEPVEFIELHNPSAAAVSLGEMYFSAGVEFVFAEDAWIAPEGFLTIAQDAEAFQRKFGFEPAGQFSGRLSNEGETITLRTAAGAQADRVDYGQGFPWPNVGDAPGYSMELIHPDLDNGLGGSWRASRGTQAIIARGEAWRYFKGTEEPSADPSAWREPGFDDSGWDGGLIPIGRSSAVHPVATRLDDLRRNYSTVYLRKTFHVDDPSSIENLTLRAFFDDGLNVWINGTHVARFNAASSELPFDAIADTSHGVRDPEDFAVPDPSDLLVAGQNVIAVQLLNQSLHSSDIYFDVTLFNTSLRAPGPTPGAMNSVFAESNGPHLQDVQHKPVQPTSDQDVTVTVMASDPDGVVAVSLEYQVVRPGHYIRKTDFEFQTRWNSLPMRDDGTRGDVRAADSIFSAVIPATLNQHRHLVRYRVRALDTRADVVVVPYADDPQPNFAYFVYDGIPDWTGANRPGVTEPITFGSDVMNQLPAYHLIADAEDVEKSHYDKLFHEVRFRGTMVYDQQVYDHISFRVRGEFSTYLTGKNRWKFFFNRGHEFQARDNYGRPYGQSWRVMNSSAAATPWIPRNRGMAGVGEAVALRLYDLAGNPSSNSNFIQFRVIDDAQETSASQYEGDLWGLYLTIEHPDGRFLNERSLPDGTTYKAEAGFGDIKHQGSTQPDAPNDYRELTSAAQQTNTELWWREHVDLDTSYTYRAINRAVANVDQRLGFNHYVYHNSETDKWTVIPWDLDALFVTNTQRTTIFEKALDHEAILTEYKNRARELQDLLFTADQVSQLVDEISAFVNPITGGPTLVDVDQFMWNHNPRTESSRQGSFNIQVSDHRTLVSGDHEGMVQWIKDFMSPEPGAGSSPTAFGWNILDQDTRDDAIPETPIATYVGALGFPADRLVFESSRFVDPQGDNTFGAMQWRLAEVTRPSAPAYDPSLPRKYEIQHDWESAHTTTFLEQTTIPPGAVQPGHAYRVRVRMQDDSGRWSHWSAPVEFIATPPTQNTAAKKLRISEIHYHPSEPNAAERLAGHVDADDFEFVELTNIGKQPVDLSPVQLVQATVGGDTEGIRFKFADSAITQLAPGERIVVVEDLDAFRFRYGPEPRVAGQWSGGLSNAGEQLSLAVFGEFIHKFLYQDDWHASTDGIGFSLEMVDPFSPDLALWGQVTGWRPSANVGGTPGRDEVPGTGGDFNGDGLVNADDIDLLNIRVLVQTHDLAFDLNDDLIVDQEDVDVLVLDILDTHYGDTNLDGVIDVTDFQTLASQFGSSSGNWSGGDSDGDGDIDFADFVRLSNNIDSANVAHRPSGVTPNVMFGR